ncbi:hypothetical protein AAG906_010887 [Vitis piasezkii]
MDRSSEKEKSNRRSRESTKDHRDRNRDNRDSRENREHKHRSKEDDEDHRHHHSGGGGDKHRSEKRSSRDDSKHRDADRHRSSDRGSKRERSGEEEREERSHDSAHSHKRKERGRVRTGAMAVRRGLGFRREEGEALSGERRKFEDRVKEEDLGGFDEVKNVNFDEKSVKKEGVRSLVMPHLMGVGVVPEPLNMAPRLVPETSLAPSLPPPTKVSSISTTNENKGVSITRSHEVPGKSSTDGTTSAAGKSGNLSLDALAKAKKALQMQKELSEKLKKIPCSSSDGSPQLKPKEEVTLPSSTTGKLLGGVGALAGLTSMPNFEAVKRAQELAAKMGFRQDPEFAPLINMFPGQMPTDVAVQQKPAKAPVLRLDALGREIDEHGNVVNMPKLNNLSTLKSNPHFDSRMGIDKNKLLRPKRMNFQFVEEGKWSRDAEIIKLKSQFGEAQAKELKAKQAQLARAKAEPDINPNLIEVSERVIIKEKPKDQIPEVESLYIWNTQRPIEPPAEPAPPPPQPLKLTKRSRRNSEHRQGLIEPPKPKVKMSNLMKVLGSEATQDPTRLEMEIAAAEREQAHTRFKVDINAQENRLTGCAVISDGISVVVVEGGSKPIKRYGKLMLKRINWAAAVENEDDDEDENEKPLNSCVCCCTEIFSDAGVTIGILLLTSQATKYNSTSCFQESTALIHLRIIFN